MSALGDVFRWFAGGRPGYMSLLHCMRGDTFWIALTVVLDLAVAAGYILIALHWRANERRLPDGAPKRALGSMKQIFIFCGLCGYVFIPIKMVWPAWRLYDGFLAVLVFYTWRYAWGARELKVVYNELGRSARLARDLEDSRAESRRKSSFLIAVSHDLRTPLAGLALNAELAELCVQEGDDRELREALAGLRSGVQSVAEILDSFLELGQLDWTVDPVRPSTFDLGAALRDLAGSLEPQAQRKGLRVRVESPAGLTVVTDRAKLLRLVKNLLGNGLKFTGAGGVTVRAGRLGGSDATIEVEDTGPGVEPAHLARLFEEFYQVDNGERDRSKGFGLGLAVARRLAGQLGGDLGVESEPGRGTCFRLTLRGVVARAPATPGPVDRVVAT